MRFSGDIIITDPCYLFHDDSWCKAYDLYRNKVPYSKRENMHSGKIEYLEGHLRVLRIHPHFNSDDVLKRDKILNEIKETEELLVELRDERNVNTVQDFMQPAYGCFEELGFSASIVGDTIYGDWSAGVFDIDKKQIIGRFCADAGMYCVLPWDEALRIRPEEAKQLEKKDWCAAILRDFDGDIEAKVITSNFKNSDGEDCVDHSVRIIGRGSINFDAYQTGF